MNDGPNMVKEKTFLESTIERITSTNNIIEDTNNKLARLLTKLRGSVPSNLNQEFKPEGSNDAICPKIDWLLTRNVDSLNMLHNQIDELTKYI